MTFGIFTRALRGKTQNQLLAVSAILVMLMGLMMTDRELKMTQSGYNFGAATRRFNHHAVMINYFVLIFLRILRELRGEMIF